MSAMERKSYRTPGASGRSAGSYGASSQARTSRASSQAYTSRNSAQPRASRVSPADRAAQTGRTSQANRFGQTERANPANRPGQTGRINQTNSATRTSGGTTAPRRPMPRRRKRDPLAIIIPICMALAVLAGIVYTGSSWFIATTNQSTYCSNIYVNGIDVSRYAQEEGAEAVRAETQALLDATYTLTWESSNWSFSARDFNASIETDSIMTRAWNIGHVGNFFDRSSSIRSLKQNPVYLTAPLNYDESLVDAFVDEIYNALYIAPRNAEMAADLDNPYLALASSTGQELDKDVTKAQIISLMESGEGGSVLPVITLEPDISTDQVLNSLELIVTYQTDISARGYNGRFNVRKALGYFYGMIVQPGETVSFNDVVGPRNGERGWQLGTEYIGGGKTQEGYGGGICQASSTLYGALLKAGMTVLDRSNHSMTVAYVDPSIDAAVDYGNKDLVFCNNTSNPITIYTSVDKEYAKVMIYGVRPPYRYEMESVIISQDSQAKKTSYIADSDGKYCYYVDEYKLYKEGHAACTSEGWLIAYDWESGEEVSRTQLSLDSYQSGYDIYWRGIHTRDGGTVKKDAETGELVVR